MIATVGLAAFAGTAFGWLYVLTSKVGRCGWLTDVALPGILVGYSAAVMLPNLRGIGSPAALSLFIATVLAVAAGLLFDQNSSFEATGEEPRGRRNSWPLLIWGVGALAYVGVPLAHYVESWRGPLEASTRAVVGVGAGAVLGQSLSWAWRLVATQKGPSASVPAFPSIIQSDSRVTRTVGAVAAIIALWLFLPFGRTGPHSSARAPANSLLVGTSSLANETVYTLDLASGNYRPLSVSGGRAHWSPDGTRMALTRKEGGLMQLWVAHADGSGLRRLTDVPGDVVDCLWSADGQRIYFLHGKSFLQSSLSAIGVDGGAPEEILSVSEAVSFPVISPDGRMLAYYKSTDFSAGPIASPLELKLFDLGTRQTAVLISQRSNWNVTGLEWTPDGQALVFAAQTDSNKPSTLEQLNVSTRQRKVLADRLPYRLSSFTWVGQSALAMLAYPITSGAGVKGDIWLVDPVTGSRKKLEMRQTVNVQSIHASAGSAAGHRAVEIDGAPASQRPIQPQPPGDQPRGVPPAPPLGR
jgi:Tol biopolymer transport system component